MNITQTSSLKTQKITQFLSQFGSALILGLLILAISRIVFIYNYSFNELKETPSNILQDFLIKSALVDIKACFTLFIPTIVIFLVSLLHNKLAKIIKINTVLFIAILIWLIIVSIINFYFYKTYDRIIDSFLFAIFKENPQAVIKTIISDYPIVWGLISLIIAVLGLQICFKYLSKILSSVIQKFIPSSNALIVGFAIIFLAIFVLGIRGSVGTFPIRQQNVQVSPNARVNASIPNGQLSFAWAFKWYRKQGKIEKTTIEDIKNIQDSLFSLSTNKELIPNNSQPNTTDFKNILNNFKSFSSQTNLNLKQNPDVFVSLLESLSAHILSFDSQKLDMYGALRSHLTGNGNYYFKNFASTGNGTADSIIRLLTSVPNNDLSTSSYARSSFLLNVLLPFKNAGYKIIYITGDIGSWRDIKNFLMAQGVDEVYDMPKIMELIPNATKGTWGVDDEYLYEAALQIIQTQKATQPDTPILVFTQSITNHPPFRMPPKAKIDYVNINKEIAQRFPYDNTTEIFNTVRYSVNEYGKYVSSLKEIFNNPESNLIIVGTGDHNIRGIGYTKNKEETLLGYMVPLFMYISPTLQQNVTFDSSRFGSHKDIFTTIYNRIPNLTYYSLGCDLLTTSNNCLYPILYNAEVAINNNQNNNYLCVVEDNIYPFSAIGILDNSYLTKNTPLTNADCSKSKIFNKLLKDFYFYNVSHQTDIKETLKDTFPNIQME